MNQQTIKSLDLTIDKLLMISTVYHLIKESMFGNKSK